MIVLVKELFFIVFSVIGFLLKVMMVILLSLLVVFSVL